MMWTLIPCTLIALIVGVSLGVIVGGVLSADKIARLQRRVETWRARAEVAEDRLSCGPMRDRSAL